jgi:hypothetical protein
MTAVHERTVRLDLSVPPERAFHAFTPRGEQGWEQDWHPVFHGPDDDDSAPGTVFETFHHGELTVWLVVDRRRPDYLRYSRLTAGLSAGTVTVRLVPRADGSAVTVTYRMTALSADGEHRLAAADADPAASPEAWRAPIERFLRDQLHDQLRRVGRTARCPLLQALFRAAPLRTGRARFRASGCPVIYGVMVRGAAEWMVS